MSSLRSASAEETLQLLRNGNEVRSLRLPEALNLRDLSDGDYVSAPIRFVECSLAKVDMSFLYFQGPVEFEACDIESLFGMAAYFFAGLRIERCVLASTTDLSCGGHNRGGHSIALSGTTFEAFVDFADCWFEGPVLIQQCAFKAGSNLLGNRERPYRVTFAVPPVITDSRGQLDLDT